MMRRLAVPALLFLAAPACSGEVLVSGETGGASSSTTGTGVSASGTGGSGGTGVGGGVGGTGVGGGPACAETHDGLSVTLGTWQGETYHCSVGAGDTEFSAAVVESDGQGLLVLDSCSPASDCIPSLSKLQIKASAIYIDVPKGTYVKVHVAIDPYMGGCGQRVQIKNLPSWDGVPNPVMLGEQLWFLGVEGGAGAFADTPVMATTEALGCFPNGQPGCGVHDDYLWHFQPAGAPGDPGFVVPMGEVGYWGANLPGGFQPLLVRNLRSFSSGQCDGPIDLAYWMAHEYPLD